MERIQEERTHKFKVFCEQRFTEGGLAMGMDTNELDTRYEDKLRTERRSEPEVEDDDDDESDSGQDS